MKTRRYTIACVAFAGMACEAVAQPVPSITYSIEWENDLSPGNNTAKGTVWAEVFPGIGTIIKNPTPPKGGNPTILKAFASSIFDLLNLENGSTGTLTWKVPHELNIANKPGTPDGNGGILGVNAGQFGLPANPSPNVLQKVKLLELIWTTSDFTPRTVEYSTKSISAKVYGDVGLAGWVGMNAVKVDGQSSFSIVPAPSMAAIILVGFACAQHRRRDIPG